MIVELPLNSGQLIYTPRFARRVKGDQRSKMLSILYDRVLHDWFPQDGTEFRPNLLLIEVVV